MRLYRILLFSLFLLSAQMVSAQSDCYELHRNNGIQLYNQGDYANAMKEFKASKSCLGAPVDNDLDEWIAKCTIVVRVTPSKLEFDASGEEEQTVEVSTNAKSFRVSGAPDWCTVTQQGKTITVSCSDNLAVAPREARISILSGGKTAILELSQKSAQLKVTFVPNPVVFASNAETQMVGVTTNFRDWSVETTPSWLVAERKADTLLLACTKNASSNVREAEVTLMASGETFPLRVRQLPGDTVIALDRKELVFPQDKSTECVSVNSNMAGWTVKASEPWIEVWKRNDSVVVTAQENPTVFSRHGSVTATCGRRTSELAVHQKPHVSAFVMPPSELGNTGGSGKETILVTSVPSDLKVYVDDSIARTTPFTCDVDYEHHSLQMGLERREYLFNDKQQDVTFLPGMRFAHITFTSPKNIGLRAGFIGASHFGAYAHFMASRPLMKEFLTDTIGPDGYHFMVGPVYQPIPYLGIYAGLGCGLYGGAVTPGLPRAYIDYEFGVMGFFKNASVSLGIRRSQWRFDQKRFTFMFGVGGYLKRYYDDKLGYCASDSRRWWSVNYVWRPAQNGKGVMFSDLGGEKVRAYLKAMYLTPADTVKNLNGMVGMVFTPVNGIIDLCAGVGADFCLDKAIRTYPNVEAEIGVILNIWRFPLTVMFHEADILNERRLFVDFGVGFHLGKFNSSTYK